MPRTRETLEDWKPRLYKKVASHLLKGKTNPYNVTINRSIVNNKGSWKRAMRELQEAGILEYYVETVRYDPNPQGYYSFRYRYKDNENWEVWNVSKEKFEEEAPKIADKADLSTYIPKEKKENLYRAYKYLNNLSIPEYLHYYFHQDEYDVHIHVEEKTKREYTTILPKSLLPDVSKTIYNVEVKQLVLQNIHIVAKELLDLDLKFLGKRFGYFDFHVLEGFHEGDWDEKKVDEMKALAARMKYLGGQMMEETEKLQEAIAARGGWAAFKEEALQKMPEILAEDAAIHALGDDSDLKKIGKMALAGMHEGIPADIK